MSKSKLRFTLCNEIQSVDLSVLKAELHFPNFLNIFGTPCSVTVYEQGWDPKLSFKKHFKSCGTHLIHSPEAMIKKWF